MINAKSSGHFLSEDNGDYKRMSSLEGALMYGEWAKYENASAEQKLSMSMERATRLCDEAVERVLFASSNNTNASRCRVTMLRRSSSASPIVFSVPRASQCSRAPSKSSLPT